MNGETASARHPRLWGFSAKLDTCSPGLHCTRSLAEETGVREMTTTRMSATKKPSKGPWETYLKEVRKSFPEKAMFMTRSKEKVGVGQEERG